MATEIEFQPIFRSIVRIVPTNKGHTIIVVFLHIELLLFSSYFTYKFKLQFNNISIFVQQIEAF